MIAKVSMTVGDIARACGGTLTAGDPEATIENISSDSRELGDRSLFIPLVGEHFDGHDFIPKLVSEGKISAFLSMIDDHTALAARSGVTSIECADTLKALGAIAAGHRQSLGLTVVAITGTNGKTTTKELLAGILGMGKALLKSEKNYNNEIGVPFTLLNAKPEHRVAVIEMGMNHSGELDRLTRIAMPDISVITNVGQGHLEFLGDVENVALAKSEIMHGMKAGSTVIINRETECYDILEQKAQQMGLAVRTFGLAEGADYRPDSYRLLPDRIEFVFRGESMSAPLYGIHNLFNIIAAIAAADTFGADLPRMKKALNAFANIEGRSQVMERGYVIINDTYNANPLSLRYALESTALIYPDRRKIAVLADMKELGESSRNYHRESGRLVAEFGFDCLCAWGDMSSAYAEGARSGGMAAEKAMVFQDKVALSHHLADTVRKGDVVLVKGSRSMKMEDVVNSLTRSE